MEFKDGGWQLTVAGKPMTPPHDRPGPLHGAGVHARLHRRRGAAADLDVEGVEKELIFPQRLFGLYMFGKMMNRRRDLRRLQRAHRRGLREPARAGCSR